MSLFTLALVMAVGLAGPLLAAPKRLRVPVVVGEILLGVVVGRTGTGWVNADEPVLSFVATAGFALVMLVAGSHVPVRDKALRVAAGRGVLLAVVVGVLAVPAGLGVAALTGTGHGLLYAVLLASSSAALVMPVINAAKLDGSAVIATMVQVAVADTVCIVALPLAEDPARAGRAALGALAVIAVGAVWWLLLWWLQARGLVERAHEVSKTRHFGLELRIALIVVFGMAGLAQLLGVSVMLAGFVAGLALAAVGEPRRLARQLFAVTDGFLGPVFFVWLGASLDLAELGDHPLMIVLAALLAVGTVVVHASVRLVGQPLPLAVLAGAQLGVPVAAVTIGTRSQLLAPGEGSAILAAALVSVAVTAWSAAAAVRSAK
ncbi:cation:proton antiporter [Actinocrispum wychmicini]|uniref:Kef-type K+ transport system membrane component KefB n=1 Tax=Actinocrispum wychmicini TaxID=1213861 RepID=A0A4R2K389_9PSEU|nr:cation:proton antiporter [Actinocrispum wychmicini]TCO60765.1 Kef-type K+ transport system membrane component KefB [Actinocrispum wychmicini]